MSREKQSMKTKDRFVKLQEVMSRCALSRTAIYAKMKQGTFPKQVSLGAKAVAWLERDIDAWMLAQLAVRNGAKCLVHESQQNRSDASAK